jgi:glutamate synthase (NADPH/NADH) large chain
MLINFFHFIAEETREWLAALGVASLKDLIGRVDLLEVLPGETDKHAHLDLSALLQSHPAAQGKAQYCEVQVMSHLIKACWLRKWWKKCSSH